MTRKMAAGNWKMHGLRAGLSELDALAEAHPDPDHDILICVPSTLLREAASRMDGRPILIGGQDCHAAAQGAYTGDISAPMLADAGAAAVIVGHSERRENHHESNELVREKARAAHDAGLISIICVGETLAQREARNTLDIIAGQMASSLPDDCTGSNTVIAYEPVWAIGTGHVPSLEQINEVHDFIRARLIRRFGAGEGRATRLLYGGSVKPDNASAIFSCDNVDGALVGGASLRAEDFSHIINSLQGTA